MLAKERMQQFRRERALAGFRGARGPGEANREQAGRDGQEVSGRFADHDVASCSAGVWARQVLFVTARGTLRRRRP